MLNSLVWVLQLKKHFGEGYIQSIISIFSDALSLGLSSSINYIIDTQVDLITYNFHYLNKFRDV